MPTVSSSNIQNLIIFKLSVFPGQHHYYTVKNIISAHLFFGKPQRPVDIALNDKLSIPSDFAISRVFNIAAYRSNSLICGAFLL